jgi:LysR family glycine cleavage system transcriptional activator
MKYRRSPPIQFVPVFEAAARHLSFKLAAQELCVSPPAVAQQIKAFEHWLGRPLFNRHTRALSLTEEGVFYFEVAQKTMRSHCQGHIDYVKQFEKNSLTVSTPLFVAQELLMPNYLQFSNYCADTELRIEARKSFVDFDNEAIDAAVRFGDGNWPDLNCQLLSKAVVSPVYGPSYEFSDNFHSVSELYKHRLIYADPETRGWGELFWTEGIEPEFEQEFDNIICDSYMSAIKAAENGLGVALGIFPTLNSWVNDKRLILLFDDQIETNKGFWLVSPKKDSLQTEKQLVELNALYCWVKDIFDNIPELNLKQALPNIPCEYL